MTKILFYLLLSCCLVTTSINAKEQFYIGTGLGAIVVDDPAFVAGGAVFSVYGGYRLSEHLSLEIAYFDSSELEDKPATFTPQILSASVMGNIPLSERLSAYGLAGFTRWEGDINIATTNSSRLSDSDITLGFGFDYKISGNLSLRQSYQYFQLNDADAHSLIFNINYHF